MGKGQSKKQGRQALYRQYRSTSFDEVVGQNHVTDLLKEAVVSGNISHAYLFTGQKGTGKTSVARILAYAVNDLPYAVDSQHLDIIEIDAASNRRIDDIRDLRDEVHIAPVSAPYKVYIIDEVHMLTGESFNALLKTLEEPPAHAIFILATTELDKVPATIISRTQRFHFRAVPLAKVRDHLAKIAEQESINIDEPALQIIAEHGEGSFRDSIGLLDQMASLGVPITTELVETVLGKANSESIRTLAEAIVAKNSQVVRQQLQDFANNGISPKTVSEQLVHTLLNSPELSAYTLAEELMAIPRAQFPQLLLLSIALRHSTTPGATVEPAIAAVVPETAPVAKPHVEPPSAPQDQEPVVKPVEEPQTEAKAPIEPKKTETTPEPAQKPTPAKDFDWQALLDAAKTANAPLHSVLARSIADYGADRLTLYFKYALHRKKMQQTMYKTQLARLISETFGVSPEIVIAEGAPPLDDPTAKQVADIMGGGEVVQA